ncbi:F-box domain-containing protein [Colletotrichum navitas]|uniref:F-box domain-containing protein n=1 Tax=Colletotrichum navitas TaxID=681940 RepID=A0AAD8QA65_9PEZI|nr:F-box domain-containing protein [Colletotrichum navitas]KAK1598868.1 F-box domain-containing protein [Colletotrichum navitas]
MPESRPGDAMEAVLAIPELLEAILVQVDMRTLLVSVSRVSRTWKAFVDGSPALQQALFFKPVSDVSRGTIHGLEGIPFPRVPSEHRLPSHSDARLINPLLAEKFDKCFFDFGPTYSFHRRANSFYELPWSTRPEPVQTVREHWGGWTQVRPDELDEESARALAESRRRFTRRGASWRRMLVSQPPPPSLGYMRFDIRSIAASDQVVSSSWIRSGGETALAGLRMGELYDVVQHGSGHHGRQSLWFRVLWGRPTSGFALPHAKGVFEKLTSQTGVVVEFMHADDWTLPNHPRDPADIGVFDAAFRCEEYRGVGFETEETGAEEDCFPDFYPGNMIWHWALTDKERAS